MRRTVVATATSILLCLAGMPASAIENQTGFYFGGAAGLSRAQSSPCGGFGSIVQCDDDEIGWKLFAGWQPIHWVGIEAGFLDLGKYKAGTGALSLSSRTDGGFIAGTLTAPVLDKAGIYAKVGAYFWNNDVTGSFGGATQKSSGDDSSALVGFGFRFPLGDRFGLRFEYERYFDVGIADSAWDGDVDFFSAHALFSF